MWGPIDYPAAFRLAALRRLTVSGPQHENNQINSFLIKIYFPRPSFSCATVLEILRVKPFILVKVDAYNVFSRMQESLVLT